MNEVVSVAKAKLDVLSSAQPWHSSTLVPHRLIIEANELLK